MYRVKLVVITSSFSAKELRQKLGHPVTTIINLFSRLSLNEATFHLCILVVATSEDERFVAPYCRSLHIAQQAKIPWFDSGRRHKTPGNCTRMDI